MLNEHKEPIPLHLHRHGASGSPRDCPYTEAQLLAINREHDARYGWSMELATVFTNPRRKPETVMGSIWETHAEPDDSENKQTKEQTK